MLSQSALLSFLRMHCGLLGTGLVPLGLKSSKRRRHRHNVPQRDGCKSLPAKQARWWL